MTGSYDDQDSVKRECETAYQRIHDLIDQREHEIAEGNEADDYNAQNRFLMTLTDQNIHLIGTLPTGVRHVRRGETGHDSHWMQAVVYQDFGYRDEPSWHPAEPGCWQIAVRQKRRSQCPQLALGRLNQHPLRKPTTDSYIRFAIHNVYTGHAETSDAMAARLAALNTPSIVALAEAIRAVLQDNRY